MHITIQFKLSFNLAFRMSIKYCESDYLIKYLNYLLIYKLLCHILFITQQYFSNLRHKNSADWFWHILWQTHKHIFISLTHDRLHVMSVLLAELHGGVIEHFSHGLIQKFGPDLLQPAVKLLNDIIVSDRRHSQLQTQQTCY